MRAGCQAEKGLGLHRACGCRALQVVWIKVSSTAKRRSREGHCSRLASACMALEASKVDVQS
jgi:hypothetical protein